MNGIEHYEEFNPDFFQARRRSDEAPLYDAALDRYSSELTGLFSNPRLTPTEEVVKEFNERATFEERHNFMLLKSSEGLDTTIDELAELAGAAHTTSLGQATSIRTVAHLTRLMLPDRYHPFLDEFPSDISNTYCFSFGSQLLHSLQDIPADTAEAFRLVTGGEGPSVFRFWSLGPYIYHNLVERGSTPSEAGKSIIDWVSTATEEGPSWRLEMGWNTPGYAVHFSKVLGVDDRMPSHLAARLRARFVADYISNPED